MVMPWLFSRSFRKSHPDKVRAIKARLTTHYLPRNTEAFERQLRANVEHDTRNRLRGIRCPTLLIAGQNDELTPPRMAEEMAAEIPEAKLTVFNEGGHGLYWEIPEQFNRAVLDFLRGLERA